MKSFIPVPDEPDLDSRIVIPDFEHYATAIGYVCFAWSNMEWTVDQFIGSVLDCSHEQRRCISTSAGLLPGRCRLLIQLLYTRPPNQTAPNDGGPVWIDATERLLNHIANSLAPKRNRLVHDRWWMYPSARQIDTTARLGRPASRSPKAVLPESEAQKTLQGIWNLQSEIYKCDTMLSVEMAHYWTSLSKRRDAVPSQQLLEWYSQIDR